MNESMELPTNQPGDVHDRHEHREVVLHGEGVRDGLGGLHHVAVGISEEEEEEEEGACCGMVISSPHSLLLISSSNLALDSQSAPTPALSLPFTAFIHKGYPVPYTFSFAQPARPYLTFCQHHRYLGPLLMKTALDPTGTTQPNKRPRHYPSLIDWSSHARMSWKSPVAASSLL